MLWATHVNIVLFVKIHWVPHQSSISAIAPVRRGATASSPTYISSTTQLEHLPAGVVTPAENLVHIWGCNDCARCVEVVDDCSAGTSPPTPPTPVIPGSGPLHEQFAAFATADGLIFVRKLEHAQNISQKCLLD